nr:unnamed protein product [Digitaria exilis]
MTQFLSDDGAAAAAAAANASTNGSTASDGYGRNTTPRAAASFFRSGYRRLPRAAEPRKHGTPPSPAAAAGAGDGRVGEAEGDDEDGGGISARAAQRRERARTLESRSRARAPGRRNLCGLPSWRSSARGAAGRRAGERRRRLALAGGAVDGTGGEEWIGMGNGTGERER